ncbi:MAG TPA: FG-GAP-like repeat-containing protein [Bacteroidia bacterium]|nr:FG-GAP-like repeat-containing protein [Bacteroidia bacterium]
MKKIIITLAIIFPLLAFAQGGWTKVINSANPVTNFTVIGVYNGAAWVDINNDGNIDLYAMPHYVFLNNGGGSFTKLTGLNINPTPLQYPGGCSWADINNDGFIDFITAQNPSEIYLNNGNNTFQNITSQIPTLSGYAAWGCVLADVNNDNKLDLLYAQAHGFHGSATPYPCKLFMQDVATFSFTPKQGYAFTDSLRPYTVPYFHDYDMDGDMDLFIATGPGGSPGPDYCYKNMKKETGNDTLYRMTTESWTMQLQDGQCYNAIDFDNDGDFDMCLTNYSGASSRFYKNNNGIYVADSTAFVGIGNKLSNTWGDFDNDGDLDVIIASDNSTPKHYVNNGNGTFTELNPDFVYAAPNSCIISCDYDNDGDLDIFIHGNNNGRALYRNDSLAGNRNWVNYTLKGTVSNTSAIGTIIKIKATIYGASVWQVRQITAQNSFQGQNDLRVHFGLGDAAQIDSVLINWPSGIQEYYINKPVKQFETLVEGNGNLTGINNLTNKETGNMSVYPNPAKNSLTIKLEGITFSAANVVLLDMIGKEVLSAVMTKNKMQLSLKNLTTGTYILRLQTPAKTYIKKILVE